MTAATRLRRAHSVPGPRLAAYWRSSMPRLEVALAVDTPRVLKLFATRVLT